MRKRKTYFKLTLVLSMLFGIFVPVALGVKNLYTISLIFTSIWFVYSVWRFVTAFFSSEALKLRKYIGKR
jgi:uncharacterized membrane protein